MPDGCYYSLPSPPRPGSAVIVLSMTPKRLPCFRVQQEYVVPDDNQMCCSWTTPSGAKGDTLSASPVGVGPGHDLKGPEIPQYLQTLWSGLPEPEIVCLAVRVPASSRVIQAAQYMRAPIREDGPSMEVLMARHGASAIE